MSSGRSGILLSKISSNLPIIIILFLALFMRLWSVSDMSLSNDELSSVWRSFMQNSWHDMMINGVMTDGHPPMTYIIMRYWMGIFGDSVLSIRLPFVLAGVLGLYYTYRTGLIWFGHTASLLAVSFLAITSYVIYFHQIARPYSFGFFCVQAAAFYWSRYFFSDEPDRRGLDCWLWTLMAIFSCYTHYFSLMAVGLIGLTGLFFLNKKNYKTYLLSGILIVLALCPGWFIFKQQLSYNGLEWLAPPGRDWLLVYFAHVMNNSVLIYITLSIFFLISIFAGLYRRGLRFNKFQLIGLFWFLVSFLAGYIKSVYSMPVLQYSCQIFTYPFIVLVFFSFWTEGTELFFSGSSYIWVFVLIVICTYDTVYRDKYYTTEHHGEIRGLAIKMADWTDKYGSDMLLVTNVNNNYYWDYYWMKSMDRGEKLSLYYIDPDTDIPKFDSLLSNSKAKYFAFGWSTVTTPDTLFKVAEKYYPKLLENPTHFNSGIRLYSK